MRHPPFSLENLFGILTSIQQNARPDHLGATAYSHHLHNTNSMFSAAEFQHADLRLYDVQSYESKHPVPFQANPFLCKTDPAINPEKYLSTHFFEGRNYPHLFRYDRQR